MSRVERVVAGSPDAIRPIRKRITSNLLRFAGLIFPEVAERWLVSHSLALSDAPEPKYRVLAYTMLRDLGAHRN